MAEPYETPPHMKEIYDKDKERYSESDRLIEEGDLKGAAEVHPDREELRNRLIASIGLETGVGITADFVTSPLLVSPIPGSRPLYYALNYGIGYGTNWLAQKIRGNENFDQGEAVAAGGFQVIPFGTTFRGFKGLSRAALKGSTGAVIGEQVRVGIDEQRFLNPEETLSAAVAGGLIGGTFKAVPETIALSKRLNQQIKGVLPGGDLAYGLGGTGGAEAMKGPGKIVRGTFQGKSYYNTTLRQTSPPNIVGQSWETRKAAAELTDPSRVTRKVDKAFTKQGMDIWKLWTTSTPELQGLPVAIHHKGPLKQVATAVKHLDTPYALEAANYMAKRLRHRLGTTIQQATPLPSGVGQNIHNRIHGYLNSILGDSSSGLLSKLEAKYNVKLSDLELYDPRYTQILDDLTDTIAESYEHIDSFWRSLANRTDLDTVTKEEWFASALDINKIDELYRTVISKKQKGPVGQTPSNIIDRIIKRTNFALETAVVLTNKTNISPNADIARVLRMNRGWEALREAVLTNKTPEQIYKQYGIKTVSLKTFKKVVNSITPKDIERARRGGIPGGPDLSPGMFPDD